MKILTMLLAVLSMLGTAAYAQSDSDNVKITLGTANKFGVLAGASVANKSAHTFVIGDVGSSPTCTVTGLKPSQVKGHLYLKCSPVTAKAQKDLTVAFDQAAAAHCDTDLTGKDLGGLKLVPGVYCFSTSAGLTGTLTLDTRGNPKSQWVFQIGTTLTTANNSRVIMTKKGNECNVYWQMGSSATVGEGSIFRGDLMAHASITLNGGTLHGRALASTGAITLPVVQETIDRPRCVE